METYARKSQQMNILAVIERETRAGAPFGHVLGVDAVRKRLRCDSRAHLIGRVGIISELSSLEARFPRIAGA